MNSKECYRKLSYFNDDGNYVGYHVKPASKDVRSIISWRIDGNIDYLSTTDIVIDLKYSPQMKLILFSSVAGIHILDPISKRVEKRSLGEQFALVKSFYFLEDKKVFVLCILNREYSFICHELDTHKWQRLRSCDVFMSVVKTGTDEYYTISENGLCKIDTCLAIMVQVDSQHRKHPWIWGAWLNGDLIISCWQQDGFDLSWNHINIKLFGFFEIAFTGKYLLVISEDNSFTIYNDKGAILKKGGFQKKPVNSCAMNGNSVCVLYSDMSIDIFDEEGVLLNNAAHIVL